MLEDMINIAIKDAFKKIDEATEKEMGQYASMSGLI
jgi:DNA-binding protein YbaB